jgi:hypothetical protein
MPGLDTSRFLYRSTCPLKCDAASVRLWNGPPGRPGTCRNQGGAAAQPRRAHQSPLKHPFRTSPSSAWPLAAGLASHAVSAHVHPRFEHACFARASARVMPARPGRLSVDVPPKETSFAVRLLYARPMTLSAGHASVENWLHLAL